MVAKLLTTMHVADVYLYHWGCERAYAVLQGDGCMGVSTSVEDDAVGLEAVFLQLVDKPSLYVALIIVDFYIGILTAELVEILLKGCCAVDAWLARAKQIEVWTVDNGYFHKRMIVILGILRG